MTKQLLATLGLVIVGTVSAELPWVEKNFVVPITEHHPHLAMLAEGLVSATLIWIGGKARDGGVKIFTLAATLLAAITLAGCYSVVMLNLGVNRNAISTAAALDEDVYCAALAASLIQTDQPGAITVHAENLCREELERQKKAARARR